MDVSHPRIDILDCQTSSFSTGFSLIEVLITLFITSIGMLSLAALQIQGLRCTHSAILRTLAVVYATEIVEQQHALTSSSDALPACAHDPCTPASISDAAIQEWLMRIQDSLPNGSGKVSYEAASATVTVGWDDHGESRKFSLSLVL